MRITPAFAETILVRDLETVAGHVAMRVKVPITDNQFGALVSFAFNCGVANFDRSTLLAKLNAYRAVGIEAFILSGYPHINECDMFARYVLPKLEHAGL